ncbi:hypothetical protein [Paenibacillus glucanolyticus]|uniref:hypothetical protein n=1 Tax=Paenibacillus glucanolyticus TaxID=59843 RepID=UPI0030D1288D
MKEIVQLKLNELNVRYNIYAIWIHNELFNLTEKYATKSNDRKAAFIAFLHKRTGLELTSNLHTVLEQINNTAKENTELYRSMTWANICTVLKHKYGIQFYRKGNNIYTTDLVVNDIVFIIEYSHWLLNKYENKTSLDEQELMGILSSDKPELLGLDSVTADKWLIENQIQID